MKLTDAVINSKVGGRVGLAAVVVRLRQYVHDPLYRNSAFIMLTQATTAFVGFAFWIIAARFYSVDDVGHASAALSAVMLLVQLSMLGLDYSLIRFLPNADDKSNDMMNSALTLGALASVITGVIFIAGLDLWSPSLLFLRRDWAYLTAFIFSIAGWTLYAIAGRSFIARRKAEFLWRQNISLNIVRIILLPAFALFMASLGIFASWGAGALVSSCIGILILLPQVQSGYRFRPQIKRDVMMPLLQFSFSNYLTSLLSLVPTMVLPLMVIGRLGAEANAHFCIGWAIANVLFAVPMGTSISLLAHGAHDESKLRHDTWKSMRLTFAVIGPLVLLVLLFGNRVLQIFSAEYADNTTALLRILAVSSLPMAISYVYFSVKRVQMRMRGVVILTGFMAVITLGGSWILLPRMGINGVGWAWLASQSVVALAIMIEWVLFKRRGLERSQ